MSNKINSADYWDERFRDNWEERLGVQQSIFFMRILVRLLPKWMDKLLNDGDMTICDWGCAEGDGVNELKKKYKNNDYYGVDFSKIAVETAKKRYGDGGIRFAAIDLLTKEQNKKYDVMLSSNVFEHFREPWSVFDALEKYAKKYFLVLVPYKEEVKREPEHFHVFSLKDFKMTRGDYCLVHLDTLNTRSFGDNTEALAWTGTQVLAIYARKGQCERMGLSANDITLTMRGLSAGEIKYRHKEAHEKLMQENVRKIATEKAAKESIKRT